MTDATTDPRPIRPFWTNTSVQAFVETDDQDPIDAVTERAREVVFDAVQNGWAGPPFDPIGLAKLLDLDVVARENLADAQVSRRPDGSLCIEYNPTRPRGRLRYSIAHEIAHTFFSDVGDQIRHRTGDGAIEAEETDDWQLELLCNVAAGELLVPALVLPSDELDDAVLSIDRLMQLRARFDVSTEAMLRRVAQATAHDVVVFAAARTIESSSDTFRIDYVVPSRRWGGPVQRGEVVSSRILAACSAIGHTASGAEAWRSETDYMVQAVGLPPYPGRRHPRVAGLLVRGNDVQQLRQLTYVTGDATKPDPDGRQMIAHVVNDRARAWGGRGFAVQLGREHSQAAAAYRAWTIASPTNLRLGGVHVVDLNESLSVASLVAQGDYGANGRLSYRALSDCLARLRAEADKREASVHLPRIGTGQGQATWELVAEDLQRHLVNHGIDVVVYTRPEDRHRGTNPR